MSTASMLTKDLISQCLAYLKETENRSKLEDYVIKPTMDIASDKIYAVIFPFLRVLSGLYLLIIVLLLAIIYLIVKRT
jgi:hypothetical protein